jgi:hypothetical protein
MQHLEERNFEHNGNTFSLRLFSTDSSFSVIAFIGSTQVSPSYSVGFILHTDYLTQHKKRLTDNLFEMAQSDLQHDMYIRA